MRILWLGNPPGVGSGYGEQAALFVPRLQALGHDVAVAANYGLSGMKLEAGWLTLYPSDNHWGNIALQAIADDHRADVIIALCDSWVLQPAKWPEELRACVWAPVDHYPIPPPALATLSDPRIRPIAMSRFGEELMRDCQLYPRFVPHGVDTKAFYPRPEIRDELRDSVEIPRDAFLVGMVAANKGNASIPRKGFPQAFHAFARFAADHPDAWLYVHSQAQPDDTGIDLVLLAKAVGCPVDRVGFPPDNIWHLGGMHSSVVAALYQAFDVLLMPSMGEGFGIPLIEAQACGVPVITSNHSAMPENAGAGWLVGGDPWWDALQSSFLIVPSIDEITEKLELAYEARGDQELRGRAVEFAQAYDADRVTDLYWRPLLAELSSDVVEVPPLELPTRAVPA